MSKRRPPTALTPEEQASYDAVASFGWEAGIHIDQCLAIIRRLEKLATGYERAWAMLRYDLDLPKPSEGDLPKPGEGGQDVLAAIHRLKALVRGQRVPASPRGTPPG